MLVPEAHCGLIHMVFPADFLQLDPQCCDAKLYLQLGQRCALTGDCYDALRPEGAAYWFSLPYRMNLPPGCLFVFHLLLMAMASALAAVALARQYRRIYLVRADGIRLTIAAFCILALQFAFLLPVLRVSLSDAPSALFALCALWLMLSAPTQGKWRALAFVFAGIFLGLAAWVRAFFLFPVLITLLAWIVLWLRKKVGWLEIGCVAALLPLLIQVSSVYSKSGKPGYLDDNTTSLWFKNHLTSPITGYDTILPFDYHAWYAPCDRYDSLWEALPHADIHSLACVMAGRLDFYFGSYSPSTYLPPQPSYPVTVQDLPLLAADPALRAPIRMQNFNMEAPGVIKVPGISGQYKTVVAQKISRMKDDQEAKVTLTQFLQRGNIFNMQVSLWSPELLQILNIEIRDHETQEVKAFTSAILNPVENKEPNYSETVATIDKSGLYDLTLISSVFAPDSLFGKLAYENHVSLNHGSFYAWDSKLLTTLRTAPAERHWSLLLLVINLVILCGGIYFSLSLFKGMPERIILSLLPALCLAMALVIVPEQRFVIFPMIAYGIYSIMGLVIHFHLLDSRSHV